MKIALIGYGKMGKTIEILAKEKGHEIACILNSKNQNFEDLKRCDVAIEFTKPDLAFGHIQTCFQLQVPIVVGTTGWYDRFEEVQLLQQKEKGALLYATNFSIGVNLFWAANKYLSKLMNAYADYEVSLTEIHHTQKLDSPSGTAITTAEQIIANLDRKQSWIEGEKNQESQLEIEALRINDTFGTHQVTYASEIDEISLRHEAKNRKGFAAGSIIAAEFLHQKQGIFTMQDLLKI